MTADQLFNENLAQYQLKAMEALHALMSEVPAPAIQDPARAKTTIQLLNIRLRSALALLRFKPRKIQAENTPKRPAARTAPEPSQPTPSIESILPTLNAILPPPAPLATLATLALPQAILDRVGGGVVSLPQHVPRPASAA